ncbi:hypothetical protein ANTQUA_LOCUS728 [Anthophora quadrimaculata]
MRGNDNKRLQPHPGYTGRRNTAYKRCFHAYQMYELYSCDSGCIVRIAACATFDLRYSSMRGNENKMQQSHVVYADRRNTPLKRRFRTLQLHNRYSCDSGCIFRIAACATFDLRHSSMRWNKNKMQLPNAGCARRRNTPSNRRFRTSQLQPRYSCDSGCIARVAAIAMFDLRHSSICGNNSKKQQSHAVYADRLNTPLKRRLPCATFDLRHFSMRGNDNKRLQPHPGYTGRRNTAYKRCFHAYQMYERYSCDSGCIVRIAACATFDLRYSSMRGNENKMQQSHVVYADRRNTPLKWRFRTLQLHNRYSCDSGCIFRIAACATFDLRHSSMRWNKNKMQLPNAGCARRRNTPSNRRFRTSQLQPRYSCDSGCIARVAAIAMFDLRHSSICGNNNKKQQSHAVYADRLNTPLKRRFRT